MLNLSQNCTFFLLFFYLTFSLYKKITFWLDFFGFSGCQSCVGNLETRLDGPRSNALQIFVSFLFLLFDMFDVLARSLRADLTTIALLAFLFTVVFPDSHQTCFLFGVFFFISPIFSLSFASLSIRLPDNL